jgi:hydroxymethylbilane synthase
MSRAARPLVIGSRGSRLALWQANWTKDRIEAAGRAVRIEVIRTSGDRFGDRPLPLLGGQGLFVKEIEESLLAGAVDIAVHSLKDLPTTQPAGLLVSCVPERADARDLLLARGARTLRALPTGSIVGTGSPRRACQILAVRPDLAVRDLRGNVETRVGKWEQGAYDAIILAAAGVARLGLEVNAVPLGIDQMIPAVGQGALAIETRADDGDARAVLAGLHHPPTAAAVAAERAFLRGLGGGCRAPIAAYAEEAAGGAIRLRGLAADPAGRRQVRGERSGPPGAAEEIGLALAQELLGRGAADLLPRAPTAPEDAA